MTTSVLKITDGTITKNFSTGDSMKLITYDAGVSSNGENVTESARVDFTGSTATNTTTLQAINLLFEQARNYKKSQSGPVVYIEYDPGSSGTAWRSRLIGGRIEQPSDLLGPWQYDTRWLMTITWTREPFWEGALTQIPLTNSSATDDISGITITNANDATAENWVSIDGVNDLIGDLNAPIKLEMYNSDSGADATDEIFVLYNVHSIPASLTHILEGEDATGGGITATGDATDSSDFYASIDWTATTETLLATWTIDTTELSYMKGGRFAILARWHAAFPYTDCWLRINQEGATGILFEGALNIIPNTRNLHLLDTQRLPAYLFGKTNLKGIDLTLYAYRNQSGTHTIELDFLMLGAISGDNGWLHFKAPASQGVAYQEYFTHDETERETYRTDTSSKSIGDFSDLGGEIMLVPGVDNQRLYFLTSDYNGLSKVDQTWTVKLWYRPRRNAL